MSHLKDMLDEIEINNLLEFSKLRFIGSKSRCYTVDSNNLALATLTFKIGYTSQCMIGADIHSFKTEVFNISLLCVRF